MKELEESLTQVLDAHEVTKNHADIHVSRVRAQPDRPGAGLPQVQCLRSA